MKNYTNLSKTQINILLDYLDRDINEISKIDSEIRIDTEEGVDYPVYLVYINGDVEPYQLCLDNDLNVTDITE